MSQHIIIEQLKTMKLHGMVDALSHLYEQPESQQLSFEERLRIVVDREKLYRENRRRTSLLRAAKLRLAQACIEEINYQHPRGLDRSTFVHLGTCDWLLRHEDVILLGPTGIGKTYLSCALGQQACRQGLSTYYFRLPALLEKWKLAELDGTSHKVMATLRKAELLILDDWGLGTLNKSGRMSLFELLEARHGVKSTLISAQTPVNCWHDFLVDSTIADAILDRLFCHSHVIELQGESMRKAKEITTK